MPAPVAVDHLEAARRAIGERPPFDAKGRGHRDTLIWRHVLEAVRDDEVVLITGDSMACEGEEEGALAAGLSVRIE
jgi:hypothetical protein